jgi:hypothetical protein
MSIVKTIHVKGENIGEVCTLFKKNKVKHWPIRVAHPGVYAVTLKPDDPIISLLLLKYGHFGKTAD